MHDENSLARVRSEHERRRNYAGAAAGRLRVGSGRKTRSSPRRAESASRVGVGTCCDCRVGVGTCCDCRMGGVVQVQYWACRGRGFFFFSRLERIRGRTVSHGAQTYLRERRAEYLVGPVLARGTRRIMLGTNSGCRDADRPRAHVMRPTRFGKVRLRCRGSSSADRWPVLCTHARCVHGKSKRSCFSAGHLVLPATNAFVVWIPPRRTSRNRPNGLPLPRRNCMYVRIHGTLEKVAATHGTGLSANIFPCTGPSSPCPLPQSCRHVSRR